MTTCTVSIDPDGPNRVLHRTSWPACPTAIGSWTERGGRRRTDNDPVRLERLCADGARAVVLDRPGRLSSNDLAAVAAAAERHDCLLVPAPLYGPSFAATTFVDVTVELLESTIRGDTYGQRWSSNWPCCERCSAGRIDPVLNTAETHYVVEQPCPSTQRRSSS